MSWRPGASVAVLRERARLLDTIRAFFRDAGVLEVETPLAARAPGTDPTIEPLHTRFIGPGYPDGLALYLQTSPEFAMKRLLAAGCGPVYQVCKAFRNGESGRRHNPEFTLLEWYRPGFDQHQLMDEVAALVRACLEQPGLEAERVTYQTLFQELLGIDPLEMDAQAVAARARAAMPGLDGLAMDDRDAWLDLCMGQFIEPRLAKRRLTFVYDYPASQAALARVNAHDLRTAARFELFYAGLELANGFHELSDATEQHRRLRHDNVMRRRSGRSELPIDERLLAALEHGLPDAAGVALGIDRLLMAKLGVEDIDAVLAFALERV